MRKLYSFFLFFFLFIFCSTIVSAQRIFWVERFNDKIRKGNLSPTGITGITDAVTVGVSNPVDLSIGPFGSYIFFTNSGGNGVWRANYDGTGAIELRDYGAFTGYKDIGYSGNAGGVFGAQIDDERGATFQPEDGSPDFYLDLGSNGNDHYGRVAVDEGNEYVYLLNEDTQEIIQTDFSGSSYTQIVALTGIGPMWADDKTGRLYFARFDGTQNNIYRVNSDGSGFGLVQAIGAGDVTCVHGYSQFGKLYYVKDQVIYMMDIGGGGVLPILDLSGTGATDIAIEADLTPPTFTALLPADGSTTVIPGANLQMTFSENMKISTTAGTANETSIRIFRTTGDVLTQTIARGDGNISIAGNIITISGITTNLNATDYYVLVGNKVFADLSGNTFTGILTTTGWNFTTVPGVTITPTTGVSCVSNYITLPDIVLTEGHNTNFTPGGGVTLIIGFNGSGYSFEAGTGTVSFTAGRNITAASISVSAANAIITYSVTGTTQTDVMTISGLKFTTDNASNGAVTLYRLGGSGQIGGAPIATTTVFGTVNSQAAPTAPVITYPLGANFCVGANMGQNIVNAAGTSIRWYDNVTLTTERGAIAGTNLVTGTQLGITSVGATTFTRYATQTSAGCQSTGSTVTVVIDAPPTVSAAGGDQLSVCNTTTTLAANSPSVGTGLWTVFSGAGGSFGNASSPISTFTGTVGVPYVLRWTISNATCTPSTDDVAVQFIANPSVSVAGSDQSLCAATTTLAANTPTVGTGLWTVFSGAGGSFTNASSPTSVFNGTAGVSYVLRWTISNGSCTPSTDDVTINFQAPPTAAAAGVDQSLCALTTTLAGNTPGVGTGTWTVFSGTGGVVTTPSNPASSFTGVGGTTYVLRWTTSNGVCATSSDDVSITLIANPTAAAAGTDQDICGTSTTLAGNLPAIGTGAWTIISGTGGTITTSSSPTSTFTGSVGSYTLRWTTTNGICPVSTDDVIVRFAGPPTTADAGTDQNICGTTGTLAANTPTSGSGVWSIVSGTGGSFTNTASPTSGFSGTLGVTYSLRWTITSGVCTPSIDNVTIALIAPPSTAAAGGDQVICTTSATLGATTPAVGTGVWSVVSGSGGNITTPASPTSAFTGTVGTTYVLRWTTSNTGCPAISQDDVSIQILTPPTTAAAGTDQVVCSTSTTLAATPATVGTGAWSIVNGAGGTLTTPASAASGFTGISGTTYILRWTVALTGCLSSTDDVSVSLSTPPSGTGTITGIASLCPGVSGNYSVTGITNATSYEWTAPAGMEVAPGATGPTASIKALSGGGGIIHVVGVNSCGTGGSAQSPAVTVFPSPSLDIITPSAVFIDELASFSVTSTVNLSQTDWSFGDGATSSDASPEHTYTTSGDFTIAITVEDVNTCVTTYSEALKVNPEPELSDKAIKNVVTTNNDTKNDVLYIDRIEKFPGNEVSLIDRWGVEVFNEKDYQNTWDLKKGGDYLPAGNYVCVVRYNGKVYSRSVTVIKNR